MFLFKFKLKTPWHLPGGWIINCWLTTSWMIYLRDITRENWQIRIFKPIRLPASAKNLHNNTFLGKIKTQKYYFRFSTSATRSTTTREDWTGWTSTASSVAKVGAGLSALFVILNCPSPSGTVFDQQTLTCNFPEDAFPCEESASLYGQVRLATFREAEMVVMFLLFQVEFGKVTEEYDY